MGLPYYQVIMRDKPIRYYRLGERSGTTAVDSSSSGQNGTLNGGITLGQAGLIKGDPTTCMSFDGSTGYISLPTTGLPTGTASWSVEAWVTTGSTIASSAAYFIVFFGTDTTDGGAEFFWGNVSTSTFWLDADGASSVRSGTITTNTSYYVAGTFDGTNYRLYVNGSLVGGPTALTTNIVASTAFIGKHPAGAFCNGSLQEVAIYSKALSAGQIKNHYQVGSNSIIIRPPHQSSGRIV